MDINKKIEAVFADIFHNISSPKWMDLTKRNFANQYIGEIIDKNYAAWFLKSSSESRTSGSIPLSWPAPDDQMLWFGIHKGIVYVGLDTFDTDAEFINGSWRNLSGWIELEKMAISLADPKCIHKFKEFCRRAS